MKKLDIGGVIGESFSIWCHSLGDVFKNNWLLILISLALYSTPTFLGIPFRGMMYGGTGMMMGHGMVLALFPIDLLASLLYLMFFGYVLRYVVEGYKRPMGLGGIYFNSALLSMLGAYILVVLIFIGVFVGLGLLIVLTAGASMLSIMHGSLYHTGTSMFMVIAEIIGVLVMVFYLSIRFTTVMQYSFLKQQIGISEGLAQTKGNVWRILAVFLLTYLLIIFFGFLLIAGIGAISHLLLPSNLTIAPMIMTLEFVGSFLLLYLVSIIMAVLYKRLAIL